ncbi:ATP-binding cassette sub- A member 5 [Branchiostoma belcheri]|nr:ATP-binding cassette sub- A member 5 [Branchiostoma belcheri]
MDVLPADIVSKLCTETYQDEEIEAAKRLLFDTCKPDERYKKRQGVNKSTANMADILRVMHSTDPECLPTFVLATLRLPAVTFDHVDITTCLQELQIVRQEMKLIRTCSIDSVKVQAELMSLRTEIAHLRNRLDSTPPTAPAPSKASFAEVVLATHQPPTVHSIGKLTSEADCVPVEAQAGASNTVPKPRYVGTTHKQADKGPVRQPSRSPQRRPASRDPKDPSPDGFHLVQRRKPRSRAVVGTATSSSLSAAKSRPAEIFVTRLKPDTQLCDLEKFLDDNLSEKCSVSCTKLKTRYDGYSSFCIVVDKNAVPELLSPSFWPCGILVRRFHGRRRPSTS